MTNSIYKFLHMLRMGKLFVRRHVRRSFSGGGSPCPPTCPIVAFWRSRKLIERRWIGEGGSHGFSLIEVLLTLAMVALIVTPIMIQQSALVRNADRISRRAIAVDEAQLFLYETQAQIQPGVTEHTAEKKVEGIYPMTLQFKQIPVSAKSDFGHFTNLVQDTVIVTWDETGTPMRESIVTFRYQYPWQQEKKK